jgi:hypothetical protein
MSDLERLAVTSPAVQMRAEYERLEREAEVLMKRKFSLVERFVTDSKLAKLAQRMETEPLQEALRAKIEAMQLARVTGLNELQIQMRAFLGVREIQCNAELLDRASAIYTKLLDSLAERSFEIVTSFERKFERLQSIQNEALRHRHQEQLEMLLDEQNHMIATLFMSSREALTALRTAYAPKPSSGG